ncbi:DUF4190 domain-containing protein [Microbacterium flavum]|uniref:DUF4190 domain-containing protein n=1 Tax=Microbacterium flavum TaxID=415216 RepID=A0ABS5XRS7_9MICO|nr:DUF4190 domain-containing protein [Microbacterium flavum]MBT8796869.1 DUF4190 domain-containing protein [Microbacterium flavum]
MTDPQNPDAQKPAAPTPPAPPAYGEYAPTTPPAAPANQQPSAPAYQQPAYAAAPSYDGGAPAPGTPVPGKTLGIVAFVLSFFFNVIGLILGIVALVQSRKAGRSNGFALAAIIIGSISIVLGIIALIVLVPLVIQAGNAATICLDNPTASVEVWGVNVPCEQILEQSGR